MPTVNDSLDPGRVLELVKRWKSTVAGFVTREKEHIDQRNERRITLRRAFDKREEQAKGELGMRLAELGQAQEAERQQAAAEYAQRQQRIADALRGSRGQLATRVQYRRDSLVGQAQAGILRNKEEAKREMAQRREENREFEGELAGDYEELGGLDKKLRRAAGGFQMLAGGLLAGKGLEYPEEADASRPHEKLRAEMQNRFSSLEERIGGFGRRPLPMLFRFLRLEGVVPVMLVGAAAWALSGAGWATAGITLGVALAVLLVVYVIAFLGARPAMKELGGDLQVARCFGGAAAESSRARVSNFKAQIKQQSAQQTEGLSETFQISESEAEKLLIDGQKKIEEQQHRVIERAATLHQQRLERLAAVHAAAEQEFRDQGTAEEEQRKAGFEAKIAKADDECAQAVGEMIDEWKTEALPIDRELRELPPLAAELAPEWTQELADGWEPPTEASMAVPIGYLEVVGDKLAGGVPEDKRLAFSGPAEFEVPVALGFPRHGSLMIESEGELGDAAATALNNIVLRVLSSLPAGRATFTMHLADYEETLINSRIWTQSAQIEEKLAEINEHIEKVIQMYLRNEFETIVDYNEQAGIIAEKFYFLVIAGFPAGFSDTASKRLLSIASSGGRCGVFLLIQRDLRQDAPDDALYAELSSACLVAQAQSDGFVLGDMPPGGNRLRLDQPPGDELATELIHKIGKAGIDSNRVEVPFEHVAPPVDKRWTVETGKQLEVAIGRTGAKKLQMLAVGKGTRQHALVAGKTGSGKSTLFHVVVTNLALWCSPEQVEFYLIDFKKGVEFKCYASKRLPHARVVAIESDREFGLSVLERVDAELRRRGDLFRAAGVQDLGSYKRSKGAEPMPRSVLLIDEFQEFFTEDDPVAQDASLLLDRIVRQGRAFGIHVILGSQTLGGAYTLARATLGQMVIRIALQCNEADAFLIMDDDNPAPRLLSRPGEGIYNDNAGALEANSPFQTVWIGEEERDAWLDQVTEIAKEKGWKGPGPVVFEGNAPADVRDNDELAKAMAKRPKKAPLSAKAWLGAPNSIKGPTHALFQRQSGSNLLIVGQGEERGRVLLGVSLVGLAAQYPKDGARFVVLDPAPLEGHGFLGAAAEKVGDAVTVATPHDLEKVMAELGEDLAAREAEGADGKPEVFVLIRDLQRFRKLRVEDDFNFSMDDDGGGAKPEKVFLDLLTDGPAMGMHVLLTIDTWNNVGRWIQRRVLGEFEMRVLFQMSANDSANLIDSPAASTLGLHRALLHNDALGTSETFRPYAEPGEL